MNGFRNVYQRGDVVFVGRYHATYEAAQEAHATEMGYEGATSLLAVATDTSGPTWEDELRHLGRLAGVTDTDASAEVIADAITSERDTLRETLVRVAQGSFMPPPDPIAHSWRAYAGFWEAHSQRLAALARLALTSGGRQ